jgi:hypothetical protein
MARWNLPLTKIAAVLERGAPLANVAIETGTCRGASTRELAREFPQVITIELSQELSASTSIAMQGEGFSNVEFLCGNSGVLLPSAISSIQHEKSAFFFLDAHWSGDASVAWDQARWKGYGFNTAHLGASRSPSSAEQCPLLDEFQAIAAKFPGEAIILVDDAKNLPAAGPGLRGLEFPGEDWSHLSRNLLRAALESRLVAEHNLENPQQWLLILRPKEA